MLKIAAMRQDVMSRFNNALMLGDVEERVKIMAELGQVPLAALTAKAHNLVDFIPKLEEQLQGKDISAHIPSDARLMLPPVPLCPPTSGESSNWPLLMSTKKIFEKPVYEPPSQGQGGRTFFDAVEEPQEEVPSWEEEQEYSNVAPAWGEELILPDDASLPVEEAPVDDRSMVTMGETCQAKWLRKRQLPCDLVAAGKFEEALQLLQRRLGLINAGPLEPLFKEAYWAACSVIPGAPQAPSLYWPLLANGSGKDKETISPCVRFSLPNLMDRVKKAIKTTTEGKFNESLDIFRSVLQSVPLSAAVDAQEEQKLLEVIAMCREYVLAMRLEVARKLLDPANLARNLELVSYFTCCKLQPVHLILTLRVAMTQAFKAQNFVLAASFARRLVQGSFGNAPKPPNVVDQARKLLLVCEQKGSDAIRIDFDTGAPVEDFKLCSGSLTPITAADITARCPYCNAVCKVSYMGTLCETCQLSKVGANTLGVLLRPF